MYCNKCGSKLEDGSKFCNKCGSKLESESKFCSKCGSKLESGSKFCNKCGNPISVAKTTSNQNNSNNSFNTKSKESIFYKLNQKIANNKGIFVFIGICIIAINLIVIGINKNKKYYFNINEEKQPEEVVENSNNERKRGKYSTIIIYDNTYSGVKIKNKNDAFNLIKKDSVSQKDKCPEKMRKVEEKMIADFGITAINLCEMDIEFAEELGNVFKKIYDEYPTVKGYITNLTLVNSSMSNNYIAAFMPVFNFATSDSESTYPWVIKTQVLLNTSYFLNKDKLEASVTDGSDSGHFPKNATIYSPVAHELGHYLSFLAMMKHYDMSSILLVNGNNSNTFYNLYDDFAKGDYSLSMINEAFENYKKDNPTTMSLDEWRGTISNYALAKDNSGEYIYDETVAESFHDVYLNGDNASDASKYIVEVLKEKLEK